MRGSLISESELKHYGVMGMRWGRRKGSADDSQTNPKGKRERRMTNKEIQGRINRLKLEKELSKLQETPKATSAIEKVIKSGKTVVEITATALAVYKGIDSVLQTFNQASAKYAKKGA